MVENLIADNNKSFYQDFLRLNPDSYYKKKVEGLIELCDLDELKKNPTRTAIRAFLYNYPQTSFKPSLDSLELILKHQIDYKGFWNNSKNKFYYCKDAYTFNFVQLCKSTSNDTLANYFFTSTGYGKRLERSSRIFVTDSVYRFDNNQMVYSELLDDSTLELRYLGKKYLLKQILTDIEIDENNKFLNQQNSEASDQFNRTLTKFIRSFDGFVKLSLRQSGP